MVNRDTASLVACQQLLVRKLVVSDLNRGPPASRPSLWPQGYTVKTVKMTTTTWLWWKHFSKFETLITFFKIWDAWLHFCSFHHRQDKVQIDSRCSSPLNLKVTSSERHTTPSTTIDRVAPPPETDHGNWWSKVNWRLLRFVFTFYRFTVSIYTRYVKFTDIFLKYGGSQFQTLRFFQVIRLCSHRLHLCLWLGKFLLFFSTVTARIAHLDLLYRDLKDRLTFNLHQID